MLAGKQFCVGDEYAIAADRVVDRLCDLRFSGRTEREMARLISDMTIEKGSVIVDACASSFSMVALLLSTEEPPHRTTNAASVSTP